LKFHISVYEIFIFVVANVRVYEPLRDSKRFVVGLPQGNQVNQPSQTRCQQWIIHAVCALHEHERTLVVSSD
jgi:hypothetical protein